MQTREDGSLTVVCGKSRSGKSAWVKDRIKNDPRVIVFDIKGEYDDEMGFEVFEDLENLIERLEHETGAARIAYRPMTPMKEFGPWCRAAFTWCKMAPCTILAEELADVTTPAKAPDGWGQVCRQAQGFGAKIFAITQRPSESDKTALGNATLIHCCQMVRAQDRAYMAREMDCEDGKINSLQFPFYWEKDLKTGRLKKGKLVLNEVKS